MEHIIEQLEEFISWKESLHSEIRGGVLMFDVPTHYKWMYEEELYDYYFNYIK